MDDSKLRRILAAVEPWEGRINHAYLDHRGNMTIGVGCLISAPIALEVLPMTFAGPPVRPATVDEKRAEFRRVKAMDFGEKIPARYYRANPPAPILYLEDSAIDELAMRRLRQAERDAIRLCPDFEAFPEPAQVCLLDLRWNLGLGQPAHGGKAATGLTAFVDLLAACNRLDWETAARECAVSTSRKARNDWRRGLFESLR